ncbi:MAG: SDR family NAD(P)-dependent oxidoreductase [Rhodobacterales bacterium]|nr:SDR family NAD(P)-dependent oxidoreductase [Rhodobacterales bacterium]
MGNQANAEPIGENDIAIVGMAAHLPGAASIAQFWDNLRSGTESISVLSDEELRAAGEDPGKIHHRNYVRAAAMLKEFDHFDADFFGFSPKEAAIMDPQHRQFLEVAWEALENAGHPPENFAGPIGVYAGCGMGSYFYFNICSNPDLVADVGMFLLRHTGNDKDFLATRVSHMFDLKGPSINMQTACSTSLVATHYACKALLDGECDMALAGGVTIEMPHGRGYIFEDGEILSPDGHCHAFDHRAEGTVFGSGAGVVVLRRLGDAMADGDHIWGVIKGSAVNNDGAAKAGYLAPSVDQQAAAIAEAHAMAGVTADTIDYVECHGTGTYLGDPIEVAALTEAFSETTNDTGFCRIGSVKTNIGHTDTAAGVASLIKTTLSLHHGEIPPSLGFEKPNPVIDFENSPFSVNAALHAWTSHKGPRRAGVNSLGVGGTNAHAVLEQAPARAASDESDWPFQILCISGRNKAALDANSAALAAHLRAHPEQPLADVAWTLKVGRRGFEKRRALVAESHEEAAALLENGNIRRVFDHSVVGNAPEVVFMFPGGGAQYVGMARDLYDTEPVFAQWMDRGFAYLEGKIDYDLRALWLAQDAVADGAAGDAEERLKRPSVQLPLIMMVEYALAQLWMSWDVQPAVLVGHSMGENTAACLAGVIGFEDCIGLVLLRGQLFDTVPAGGMLSVACPLDELRAFIGDDLDIAGVNAPDLTAISGPQSALDALAATLDTKDISYQRIAIDIAAHSRMLEPILARFGDYLRGIQLAPPRLPFVSNRTGELITDAQATDPQYWVEHLRGTIYFADCITTLAANPQRIYVEMGPGKALSSLTQMHGAVPSGQVFSVLRHRDENIEDDRYFLGILGRLWATGVEADWGQYWGDAKRQRVPLPTYAFQRTRYFIEPGKAIVSSAAFLSRKQDLSDWGSQIHWRPRLADCDFDLETEMDRVAQQSWLVFMDRGGLGAEIARRLRGAGHPVTEVRSGDAFGKISGKSGEDGYVIAPEHGRAGYDQLVQDLVARGRVPTRIVNLWLYTGSKDFRAGSNVFHRNLEQGFYSLLFLAQAIADENLPVPLHITNITSGAMQVRQEALPYPEKATAIGPLRVIPREFPGVTCSALDVEPPKNTKGAMGPLALRVLEDLLATPRNVIAALRGDKRFEQELRAVELGGVEGDKTPPLIRENGTYLITGGFGGIGLTIAERLVRDHQARIVLVSRGGLPEREKWNAHLATHARNDSVSARIRAVQALEDAGGEIMVASADVSNIADMRAVVDQVNQRFGAINGVIHGAGTIDDAPLLAKSLTSIENVFTPKLHGTEVIDQLFPDGTLDWLVLFASTSTITAPAGQVDYVAANEFLNAYAKSRTGGKTRVMAINWGIWNEVGMAAQAVAARDCADAIEAPIAINMPLLDEAGFDGAGNRIFNTVLRTDRWVLDDHRTKDRSAILPGTGYLELAAEALRGNGENTAFEIRDLLFLRALKVPDDGAVHMRVRLARGDEGYRFEVFTKQDIDGRTGYLLHAEATLVLEDSAQPAALDIAAILDDCPLREHGEGAPLRSPQEAHLAFGPRWRVLNKTAIGATRGVAHLSLPPVAAGDPDDGYLLHPALMDLATGWAMHLIEGYEATHLWVPVSYSSIKVLRPLPAQTVSVVEGVGRNQQGDETAIFDVDICDSDGAICVAVRGFSIRRLDNASGLSQTPAITARDVEFDADNTAAQPLSAAEERLRHNLSQGIKPKEGAEAFLRALATDQAQIFVSSLDMGALIEQADAGGASDETAGQTFERPELDTDYVAPENDIERTLAGFWQGLLGVDQVGTKDSFFDLGGHSLIAVRLFAMVKKAYRIEFPISILFEAPTIAQCSALIAEQIGGATDSGDAPETSGGTPKTPTRRFKHLVPMHQGEGGTKTPFFLVAGMFGNVLNLRHLAHLVGADRPFYGLQARGLYGDDAPHETLPEAAADYIAEMRQVQPNGPYLLGGFSGGGITAYEIAHQLEEQGESVALLVMLDTPLPRRLPLSRSDRMSIQWQELRKKGIGYPVIWARNRIRWEIAKRRKIDIGAASCQQFHNAEIEAAFLRAVAGYPIKGWSGRALLLRPKQIGHWTVGGGRLIDSQRAYVLPDNGWNGLIEGGIEVIEVPGDHDSMVLEPNVRVLAAQMKRHIEQAEVS